MQPASSKTNAVSAAAVVAGEAVPAEKTSVDTAGGAAQRVEHTEQEAAVLSKVNAASVAAPTAQQAQQRTARIKAEQPAGKTVQHVQPVNEYDVVDITADDTDSSQLSAEPVLNSTAAETVQAPASVSDITMAEVTQADQSRVAAEAFISLEPEAATGCKAVSPTNPAQPNQAAQGLQSIVIPSQQSADATAAAPAKDALGKQLVGVDDSLTVLGLQPLPAHRKPLSAAASPDSRPASANGRPASARAAAASSMLYPDQKALPASKTKAAGKGGIQIVMATKHKEVISPSKQQVLAYTVCIAMHIRAFNQFPKVPV